MQELTVKQAAEIRKVNYLTLLGWIKNPRNTLAATLVEGRWRIKSTDLATYKPNKSGRPKMKNEINK